MKNLIKFAFVAITLLLFCNSSYAQITITDGSNYYVCQGEAYTFEVSQTAVSVHYDTNWRFDNVYQCSGTPPCIMADGVTLNTFYVTTTYNCNHPTDNNFYGVNVTLNTPSPVKVRIQEISCPTTTEFVTFTITPYVTSITGETGICNTGSVTYTATVNGGLVPTNYSWTLPSFLSGSSSTDQISVSGSATALVYGNITVTDNGCPAGSASNTGTLNVYNVPAAPTQAPGGTLTYQQHGRSCWWDAYVPSVSNAAQYQWSFDSTFATFITTDNPVTTTGPFLNDNYTYTVYVRGINACGDGPYSKYIKKTPPAPTGCLHHPIDGDTSQSGGAAVYSAYKVYPNPAGNYLTVEYLQPSDNTPLSFTMYDMLGQRVAGWNLKASDYRVSENISSLPAGIYLYEITSMNAPVAHGKLMIER